MLYYLQTMPGLGQLAWQEVQTRLGPAQGKKGPRTIGIRLVPRRNDIVLLHYGGDARALLQLRTSEDVFAVAVRAFDVAPDERGLRQMHAATRESRSVGDALAAWTHVLRTRRKPTTFRVVVREVGAHQFRRRDIGRAVADGILSGWPGRWHQVDEEADVEVWVTLLERELLCGVRLSGPGMRQREKVHHMPAALRPALAAAMIQLTEPAPDDVFLDPMAGTGTLLIERAAAGPFRHLYGGDNNVEALKALRTNTRTIRGEVTSERWDARKLPLADQSVDKIAVNMPFGKQVAVATDLPALYRGVLAEVQRVLRHGGRFVALAGDAGLLDAARAATAPGLHPVARHRVIVLGTAAAICVYEKSEIQNPKSARKETVSGAVQRLHRSP